MAPNPAFKPTSRFTSIFTRVHGYVWIDEDAAELARVEGDVTEDISIGLFLGKIYKGSHFMLNLVQFLHGLTASVYTQYEFDAGKVFGGFAINAREFHSNCR